MPDSLFDTHPSHWDPDRVYKWILTLGKNLTKFAEDFKENQLNGEDLYELEKSEFIDQFKDMKNAFGKKKLWKAIVQLRKNHPKQNGDGNDAMDMDDSDEDERPGGNDDDDFPALDAPIPKPPPPKMPAMGAFPPVGRSVMQPMQIVGAQPMSLQSYIMPTAMPTTPINNPSMTEIINWKKQFASGNPIKPPPPSSQITQSLRPQPPPPVNAHLNKNPDFTGRKDLPIKIKIDLGSKGKKKKKVKKVKKPPPPAKPKPKKSAEAERMDKMLSERDKKAVYFFVVEDKDEFICSEPVGKNRKKAIEKYFKDLYEQKDVDIHFDSSSRGQIWLPKMIAEGNVIKSHKIGDWKKKCTVTKETESFEAYEKRIKEKLARMKKLSLEELKKITDRGDRVQLTVMVQSTLAKGFGDSTKLKLQRVTGVQLGKGADKWKFVIWGKSFKVEHVLDLIMEKCQRIEKGEKSPEPPGSKSKSSRLPPRRRSRSKGRDRERDRGRRSRSRSHGRRRSPPSRRGPSRKSPKKMRSPPRRRRSRSPARRPSRSPRRPNYYTGNARERGDRMGDRRPPHDDRMGDGRPPHDDRYYEKDRYRERRPPVDDRRGPPLDDRQYDDRRPPPEQYERGYEREYYDDGYGPSSKEYDDGYGASTKKYDDGYGAPAKEYDDGYGPPGEYQSGYYDERAPPEYEKPAPPAYEEQPPEPPRESYLQDPTKCSPIPCKFFAMGVCRNGESCTFLHPRPDREPAQEYRRSPMNDYPPRESSTRRSPPRRPPEPPRDPPASRPPARDDTWAKQKESAPKRRRLNPGATILQSLNFASQQDLTQWNANRDKIQLEAFDVGVRGNSNHSSNPPVFGISLYGKETQLEAAKNHLAKSVYFHEGVMEIFMPNGVEILIDQRDVDLIKSDDYLASSFSKLGVRYEISTLVSDRGLRKMWIFGATSEAIQQLSSNLQRDLNNTETDYILTSDSRHFVSAVFGHNGATHKQLQSETRTTITVLSPKFISERHVRIRGVLANVMMAIQRVQELIYDVENNRVH